MDKSLFGVNQQCIALAYGIISSYRKQCFFSGAKDLTVLLKKLNSLVEYIFSHEGFDEISEEIQLILPALLDAQSNQDYVLQADILEGDLLPLLQKVQIIFQECDMVQVPDFFNVNMGALRDCMPDFYARFDKKIKQGNEENMNRFFVGLAINGQPTLQASMTDKSFYMHSSVNPDREAKILVDSLKSNDKYVIFGMGLGYHVYEILNRYRNAMVMVYESNIYILKLAFSYTDWSSYIKEGRLQIIFDTDVKSLITKLGDDMHKDCDNSEFLIHYPTIRLVEDKQVRQLLEDFFMTTSSMREQGDLLDSNFKIIDQHDLPECSALQHLFKESPDNKKAVVIVGAGPSANESFEYIRKYREKFTIFATGHIVRSLIRENIVPDVIMLTDPQPHMYKQIDGLDLRNVPLILLSTGSASILEHYNGPIYVAYQNGYEPAEIKAASIGAKLFETGGSVTTTALDIALQFGAKRIIFAGVDLAYTGGFSHAKGEGRKVESTDGLRQVKSCVGGDVYTSKNLDIYRKWIERRIAEITDVEIYNTGKGADIEGTVWKRWEEIV